jgi:uncharacterized membrane protein
LVLLYRGDASASRELLATIAGAVATVAGVTFSITMVVLSLAASQLGPQLLRNFMRDRVVHVVLGAFLATFAYCLVVLRSIHTGEDGKNAFVPNLSVTMATALTLVSLGLFILFIHHLSRTIQAPRLIANVGGDLLEAIAALLPEREVKLPPSPHEQAKIQDALPADFAENARPISIPRGLYVQAVDYGELLKVAEKHDLLVVLDTRPGDFVVRGHPLAQAWPRRHVDDQVVKALQGAFVLGHERTMIQDVRFGIAQLVEVAAIALSPGVNEPFTAIACIHQLSEALTLAAARGKSSPYRWGRDGQLRMICQQTTFRALIDEAFEPIRSMAAGNAMVLGQLMAGLAALAATVWRQEDREAVMKHAQNVRSAAKRSLPPEDDREPIEQLYWLVIERLKYGGFVKPYRDVQSPPERPAPPPPPPHH